MQTKLQIMKFREFLYLVHGWLKSRPIGNYFTIKRALRQDDFKYIELLGDGSNGVVVAAEAQNVTVAIKIVDKKKICYGEETIWPQLLHRHIAEFIRKTESGSNQNLVFYTMLPVAPVTLDYILCDRRIRRGDGSLCVRSKWFRQLLQAMAYLHDCGVCHLDIIPENILVSSSSDIILADFGQARNMNELIPTKTGFNHLKPVYRAPETFKRIKVDGEKCDLWNFGLVVIESLTHFVVHRKAPKKPREVTVCNSGSSWSSLSDEEYWDRHLCPFFLNILHERNFTSLVKCQCVNIRLYALQFRQILDFLGLFMTPEPEDRISAVEALDHPFMLDFHDISFHVGNDFTGERKGPDGFYNNDCNLPKRRYRCKAKNDDTMSIWSAA